jgi:hypothetical protein
MGRKHHKPEEIVAKNAFKTEGAAAAAETGPATAERRFLCSAAFAMAEPRVGLRFCRRSDA